MDTTVQSRLLEGTAVVLKAQNAQVCRTKADLSLPDVTYSRKCWCVPNNHGYNVAPLEKVVLFLGHFHGLHSVLLNKLVCNTVDALKEAVFLRAWHSSKNCIH